MEDRGELHPVQVEGVWRFDPRELDAVSGGGAELGAAELLSASTALVRQAHAHAERLLDLTATPAARLLELMTAENKALRERIDALEKKNTEMLAAAEAALTMQHERELEARQFEHAQRIKEGLFQEFQRYMPELVARFGRRQPPSAAAPSTSTPPSPSAETSTAQPDQAPSDAEAREAFVLHVCELVASLTDRQIAALVSSGVHTSSQLEQLVLLRGVLTKAGNQDQGQPS
jgi:hypothetical protein